MLRRGFFLLLIAAGVVVLLRAAAAPPKEDGEAARPVVVTAMEGIIGPPQADWMAQSLDRATARNARALVLRLDTPGGLSSAMRDIIQSILSSPIPVLTWVAPSGSRAASAGTYIFYASHVAAMAPGTNLGAATPIQMGGGGMPGSPQEEPKDRQDGKEGEGQQGPQDPAKRKMVEDAVAYLQSLADLRERNRRWAERAVREGASLPAREAVDENVADFMAANLDRLLTRAEGRTVQTEKGEVTLALEGAPVERIEPGWRIRLLQILANPNIAYILMLVGIYGLIFELASPGAIVPGVLGGISLLLALYAFQALPVNFAGLALMGLGVLFFIAEALVPSFGALGIGGLAAFVLGSILLMDTDLPALEVDWALIGTMSVITGGFMLAVATMAARSHRRQSVSGTGHLIGHTAVAIGDLDPEGWVRFEGERWQAHAEQPIQAGEEVRITAVHGLTLEVTKPDSPHQEE
ncbi:NfeD family protein [Thiohalorhabdus sp. Cl-TMA]|uniref:Nodulation protein NfeD n=1 Tax=Thiohalorhabdus methylotrophus TaxID=3242694 RepID=A0ABV4TU90_9GAMM